MQINVEPLPAIYMSVSYRLVTDPADAAPVLNWFCQLREPPLEVSITKYIVLHFARTAPFVVSWQTDHRPRGDLLRVIEVLGSADAMLKRQPLLGLRVTTGESCHRFDVC
jgi:hypothetical protein